MDVELRGTKTCRRCGEDKPLTSYPERKLGTGRRRSHCSTCKAAYQKAWYEKNKERHKANVARIRRAEIARNKALIRTAKDVPCLDCGRRYPPYVMDFDHVRGVKRGNVALLVASLGTSAVIAEIAKCEVVCANCHRIRTVLRRLGRWPADRSPAISHGTQLELPLRA